MVRQRLGMAPGRHALPWVVMDCHWWPWFIYFHVAFSHELPGNIWGAIGRQRSSWIFAHSHEMSWTVMKIHELSWTVMNCHELSWTVMNWDELSWTVMNCHELSWTEINCQELSWTAMNWIELLVSCLWPALACGPSRTSPHRPGSTPTGLQCTSILGLQCTLTLGLQCTST